MSDSTFLSPFNAKTMTFNEVAATFCPSQKYVELAGGWNALLIGPRGSGKTTLMKMLSFQGMLAWPPLKLKSRPKISYTGIFIPADIAWSEMVRALTFDTLDSRSVDLITETAFVTNTLLSTARTIELRVGQSREGSKYQAVSFLPDQHDDWIRNTAKLWKLELTSISLRSLTAALESRLLNLRRDVRFISFSNELIDFEKVKQQIPYLGLPLIDSVAQALISFNHAVGESDHKWALLFDEFEVAPISLQSTVLAAIRGGPPELLLKVALAPCGVHTSLPIDLTTAPSSRNDFRQVLLWYPDRGQAEKFCEEVCQGWLRLKAPEFSTHPLKEIFDTSSIAINEDGVEISESDDDEPDRQKKLQELSKIFVSLASKDETFKDFLARRRIDPNNLAASDDSYSRATIRKISSVVAFRNAYRSETLGRMRGRRPFVTPYIGWEALAAMSEGNPRWMIGLLISIWTSKVKIESIPISHAAQTYATKETGGIFLESLRYLATRSINGVNFEESVLDIVKKIANYFHDRLVNDVFEEDPPMVFEVDKNTPPNIIESLRLALNHGAIICYEGPDRPNGYDSLIGRKFRLAFLLAQQFKLPIRKSKSIALSTILHDAELSTSSSVKNNPSRLSSDSGNRAGIQGEFKW